MLSHAQASAGAVVAAARGPTVYVAMSGDVAAFSWSGGMLDGRHTAARVDRPLGLEPEPPVSLWSAPFGPGDRLVLICGAEWHDDASSQNEDVLRDILSTTPTDQAPARIADALVGPSGAARVLVADGAAGLARRDTVTRPRPIKRPAPSRALLRRLVPAFLGLLLLSTLGASPFNPLAEPRHVSLSRQATALIQQAEESADLYEAHTLATQARKLVDEVARSDPGDHAALVDRSTALLDQVDRVSWVTPRVLVRLGAASANVVDLAVSADTLYTLNTADGCVRRFDLDTLEQVPTPDTVVLHTGSLIGGRPLEAPVAMEYVPGSGEGALTVVDQARRVIQVKGGSASVRPLPSSRAWQQLAGLASDAQGNLYVLDQQADHLQLLLYPGAGARMADPPRVLVDPQLGLPEAASELLPLEDLFVIRDDGQVARYDRQGKPLPFNPVAPDGPLGHVASAAPDGGGGLFLADPQQSRILETAEDGSFVRQLRADDLVGLRALHLSPDGRALYGLSSDGILAIDL
jgi:hypothetical protein